MAQLESVKTAAATEADLDDEVLNPDFDHDESEIHLTLIFDGVTFDFSDLYDMLNTQFGTVTTDKVPARGSYIFRISA